MSPCLSLLDISSTLRWVENPGQELPQQNRCGTAKTQEAQGAHQLELRGPGMQRALFQPWSRGKHKVQTSDPDLVTKLSAEEPADPHVMTAAQGQLSTKDACVGTMGPL